jgi:hypothetical protein
MRETPLGPGADTARKSPTTEGANVQRNHITRRRRLARRVTAATQIEQPIICRGCAYPYLVHPTITAACTPPLQAIAATLNEEQHPIADEILDAVRTFVSDGRSPFFGRDVTLARHQAAHLRELVRAGHQQPTDHSTAAAIRDKRVVAPALVGSHT